MCSGMQCTDAGLKFTICNLNTCMFGRRRQEAPKYCLNARLALAAGECGESIAWSCRYMGFHMSNQPSGMVLAIDVQCLTD